MEVDDLIKLLLSFLTSSLKSVTSDLKDAYLAKTNAKTEQERILADERISILEARRDTILAAQSNPVERFIRPLFALPFIIYIWKLVIWDKVLELGSTDPLGANLDLTLSIILSSYFISEGVKRIFR